MRKAKSCKHILVLIITLFCFYSNVLGFTSKMNVNRLGDIDGTTYYDLQTEGGQTLYCLDKGLNYCGGYGYTYKSTIKNSGLACGIIYALKEKKLTVSQVNDVSNNLYTSKQVYGDIQKYIWWYNDSSKCENNYIDSPEKTTGGVGRLTASVSDSKLEYKDGKYISKKITVSYSNLKDGKYKISLTGAPKGTIVTDNPNGTKNLTESSSSSLYIVVPATSSSNNITLSLKGKYETIKTKTRTTYNVTIDYYTTSTSPSSCAGGSNSNQRLGIVKAEETTRNIETTSPVEINKTLNFSLPSCDSDFNSKKDSNGIVSMEDRIDLYKVYNKRSLLNMSNDTAYKACNVEPSCTNTISIGCLSAVIAGDFSTFGPDNLSCYEETIQVSNYIGYCGVNFDLVHYLNSSSGHSLTLHDFGSNFKSGQMVLKRDNPLIAEGTITKTCYVYGYAGDSKPTSESNNSYSDYIGELKFNDQELDFDITKNDGFSKLSNTTNEKYATFTKSITVEYKLKPVYSKLGTGEISYEPCDSITNKCKFLGYGFATKLNETNGDKEVNFSLTVLKNLIITQELNEQEYSSNACKYSVENEIIDNLGDPNGDLNLEFRIIDTNDPFPGKSGNGRQVGENWCAVNPDLTREGSVTSADSQTLKSAINNGSTSKGLDLNKDGKVSEEDRSLLKDIIMGKYGSIITEKDCSSNNYYIKYIMNKTNNSYDKNNDGPIYTIELNSSTINSIRTYNKTHSYDDYNMECDSNGENCKSLFLEEFEISRNQ